MLVFSLISPYNLITMESTSPKQLLQNPYWRGLIVAAFGLTLFAWLMNTPPGILGKADAIGYAVCHRIDLRSFYIGDRQIPLCARCSGMYLGAMLGLGYQLLLGTRRTGIPSWKIIVPTSLFVLAFVFDGFNSFLNLFPGAPQAYNPSNSLRLLTGTGMGLAIAILIYPAFNSTAWRIIDLRPAFTSFYSFVFLILIALGLDLLILQEIPVILYPLSIISAAGVLVILTMVYTMLLLILFKSENRYNQLNQMIFALLGGVTVALIQIGLLDAVRYFFTGTWDGFHL